MMRRGLIAVRGRVDDFAAAGMVAGSLFAFGGLGRRAGFGLRRGTLVDFAGGVEVPPTFLAGCDSRPAFLAVMLRRLRTLGFDAPAGLEAATYRRYCGDVLELGKGELLARVVG